MNQDTRSKVRTLVYVPERIYWRLLDLSGYQDPNDIMRPRVFECGKVMLVCLPDDEWDFTEAQLEQLVRRHYPNEDKT